MIGFFFTFCLSSCCWVLLLVYGLQFKIKADDIIWQDWFENLVYSTGSDLFAFQPMLLMFLPFVMLRFFYWIMPQLLTTSSIIKTRLALWNSMVAVQESPQFKEWANSNSIPDKSCFAKFRASLSRSTSYTVPQFKERSMSNLFSAARSSSKRKIKVFSATSTSQKRQVNESLKINMSSSQKTPSQ